MNKKFTLYLSAFVTAFMLAGGGIVIMAARSSSAQNASAIVADQPVITTESVSTNQPQAETATVQDPPGSVIVASNDAPANAPTPQAAAPVSPERAAVSSQPIADTAAAVPGVAVTSDAALQAAMQAAPGATLQTQPELVDYQGTTAYEVAFDSGKVYIDANTGAVLANDATLMQAQTNPPQFGEGEDSHHGRGDAERGHDHHEEGEDHDS